MTLPAPLHSDVPSVRRLRPPATPSTPAAEAAEAAEVGRVPVPTFERFYAQERERLGRAIAFAIGDADLAAEAVDEAFTRAYERWRTVSRGNPPAWVYRVALNWSLSVLRRRKLARKHLYRPIADDIGVIEPDVHRALGELDPKHRAVVVCRHLLGWSVAETAQALHLREGTVKSRLSRANQQLQARLGHLRPEQEPS